jgi:hypothetical protein
MSKWHIATAEELFEEYLKQTALADLQQVQDMRTLMERKAYSGQAASVLPDQAVEALRIRRRRKATMGIEIMAMTAKQEESTGSIIIKTEISISMRELVNLSSAGQFPDTVADKLMMKMRKEIEATVRRLMGKG